MPIVTAQAVEVANLGLTATAASVGGAAVLALYTEILDETGHHPGTRFAYTMSFGIAAGSDNLNGVQFGTRSATNIVYWVVAKISELNDEDIEIYRYAASGVQAESGRLQADHAERQVHTQPTEREQPGPVEVGREIQSLLQIYDELAAALSDCW